MMGWNREQLERKHHANRRRSNIECIKINLVAYSPSYATKLSVRFHQRMEYRNIIENDPIITFYQ